MTIIAYRDGVLAADTCMVAGRDRLIGVVKIARCHGGELAGAAGDAGYNQEFLRWALGKREHPPEAKKDDSGSDVGFIFHPAGLIEIFDPAGRSEIRPAYFADGSGRSLALGAMFAGADAITAVRAAIAHDAWCAGHVSVLTHGISATPASRAVSELELAAGGK